MRFAASAVGLRLSLTLSLVPRARTESHESHAAQRAALGITWARAYLTSSMRAAEFGMPKVWFPDIEPEASKTIMASSLQGAALSSSALSARGPHAESKARATAVRQDLRRIEGIIDPRALPTSVYTVDHLIGALRCHRTVEGLCQGSDQILFAPSRDIKTVIALSEAFRFTNALLPGPGVVL